MGKGCEHCNSYNIWKTRKSELYFLWPVTSPFYIMHVDIWSPGHRVDETSEQNVIQLMNSMCDLTQFVISSIVKNINAEILSKTFMEEVALSFGMKAVIVVDADSKFRGIFEETCTALKIHLWPLARGNHKGLTVERYHGFLNKTQTITRQDRGTHLSILQNAKTSQYAWNSAQIDNTDMTRILAAVGR